MVLGLGKLFGRGADTAAPPAGQTGVAVAAQPETARDTAMERESAAGGAFLHRDPVFNRAGRIAGHIFRLNTAHGVTLGGSLARRRAFDEALLHALLAGDALSAAGSLQRWIPVSSGSLSLPVFERLSGERNILLLTLSPESTDADALCASLNTLRGRGLRIAIIRDPGHPLSPAVMPHIDAAVVDIADSAGGNVRDFAAAVRSSGDPETPLPLMATSIESFDDYNLAHRCRFDQFQGPFFTSGVRLDQPKGDPHKVNLLRLMNLVQSDAETPELAAALKQDPMLAFRILRYLNSPAIGLTRTLTSIEDALLLMGRQRLLRWLSVLIFSVRTPEFSDWLLVESALSRGRMMELLGKEHFAPGERDALFLTGIFSTLDRLLHIPLADAVAPLNLPPVIHAALIERAGPYFPLLALAEAGDAFDPEGMEACAQAAGVDSSAVNAALINATAWASEVTEHWD